jgi:hypothetical protein
MMKFIRLYALACALLLLLSCATSDVPVKLANTYEVTGKVYCDTAIFKNIEQILVNILRATVLATWEPVCGLREND